jgi:ribosome-associated protein
MTKSTATTAGAKAKTAAKAPNAAPAKSPAKSSAKSSAKAPAKVPAKAAPAKSKAPTKSVTKVSAKSSTEAPVKTARKKAAAKVVSPSPDGKPARVKAPKASAKTPDRLAVVTKLAVGALEDMKAQQLRVIDVRGRMDVADTLIIASGTSDRHVKSLAANVVSAAKKSGHPPYGVEGERTGEWVLVDLHEVIVHVMLPAVREFYAIEKLWEASPAAPQAVKSRS